MKVGIDLDETITAAPEFFSLLTHALCVAGHEVHVITYREAESRNQTEAELAELGIRYSLLHLPPANKDGAVWKAELVKTLGIEIIFDDSPEVLAEMPSSVKRFWLCDPDVFDLKTCIAAMRAQFRIPVIR